MSKTSFIATLFVLAVTGCTAPEASEPPEVESSEDALRAGGTGGRLGYSCSGLLCTCRGDDDCNDMFGDGVCGDITQCDDTNPLEPVCSCIRHLGLVRGSQPARAPGSATLSR